MADSPVNVQRVQEDVSVPNPESAPRVHPETTPVDVTYVTLDEIITDPTADNAVQVPDEGKGFTDLPIHRLDAKSPEQQFADGDAREARGQVDGVSMTADEAQKAEAKKASKK